MVALKFLKMHGLGNDFVVYAETGAERADYPELARRLCDRHLGIGADGLIVALPSEKADVRMRHFNPDGSEAEMCGNGVRCFARFVYEAGLVRKEMMALETLAGLIKPELEISGGKVTAVRVDMGRPSLERSGIPMQGPPGRVVDELLRVGETDIALTSLLMGVPHTVIFVDDAERADVTGLGPRIETHPAFPRKTNVNFVEVVNGQEIKVRTWERGVGPTLACGTGSCAAVVAGCLTGKTGRDVTVRLQVGDLRVQWPDDGTVYMAGPAVKVFTGEIELD